MMIPSPDSPVLADELITKSVWGQLRLVIGKSGAYQHSCATEKLADRRLNAGKRFHKLKAFEPPARPR